MKDPIVFTPPTKRTTGQCNCTSLRVVHMHPPEWHACDCPALYPLQSQPGDEPDTLTKLTRLVRTTGMRGEQADTLLALISEAAEERKALETARSKEHEHALHLEAQIEGLKAGQRSASEARQQAFRDLAEELLAMDPQDRDVYLRRIVDRQN